jgi:hypothetical protein
MDRWGIQSIDPSPEAAREWKAKIEALSNATISPTVQRSTYMGGTIPGKPFEQLNWTGGLPKYTDEIRGVLPGLKGFKIVERQA